MPLLTVNNTIFSYPDEGTSPGWGGDASAWAQAVTDVLNTLLAPGDIIETSFVIGNNIISIDGNSIPTTIVNGLTFDAASVRAANIDYDVYRTSTGSPAGHSETGTIYLTYDGNATVGSKWNMSQTIHAGNAGIVFGVHDNGQITYITTDITAPGYSGRMRFRARTLGI